MRNNKVRLGIVVLAAVTVFTATAFAASPENEGYEALKQIMQDSKRTETLSSASFNGTFQITDNGTIIAGAAGEVKGNHEAKEASGSVQLNLKGKEQDLSFFQNGEEVYLADETNTKYYKLVNMEQDKDRKYNEHSRENYTDKHEMGTVEESLLDYFVGDLKSQIELAKNGDGTKTFTMDLNQEEIPMPLNLLTALAVEHKEEGYNRQDRPEMNQAQKQLLIEKLPFLKDFVDVDKDIVPVLKENVKLTALVIKFNVDSDDQVKSFEAKVNITGNDVEGVYHEIMLQGTVSISDINNTKVDEFSQDGKNVEIIDAEAFKCNKE